MSDDADPPVVEDGIVSGKGPDAAASAHQEQGPYLMRRKAFLPSDFLPSSLIQQQRNDDDLPLRLTSQWDKDASKSPKSSLVTVRA
jgi:hypothetical protein